jgi:hypothetical protein
MIEPLLFPVLFLATRYLITDGMSRAVTRRLTHARSMAVRAVNGIFVSTLVNVTVNIAVLLVAIHGLRDRLTAGQLVLAVTTVYAASVLHATLKFITNGYWIYDLGRHLLRHGLHGPKAWLRAQIAGEVRTYFSRMGVFRRLVYRLSNAPRPDQLVEILTREIWKLIAARLAATVMIIVLYIAVFTLYTRPILIQETTRLNWLQAFLWPFGYSVDYFLTTRTTAWIESALRF